ncbi:MAG: ribonuclease J [bacterium]
MSKIKIFGLGGLDEEGKNAYVVEVDNSIFVFDCGLKYASGNMLGIDYIIPDFSYLVKNKKKIKGLFITHGHKENMGSVKDLVSEIPELKVYATKFTKYMLIESGVEESKIVEISAHKKLNFGMQSVFPISVSHSIPDSVMYVLNTKDGAICYTGDFILDPTMINSYDMDLGKIAYIGKLGVLALLSESTFSEKKGHTSPKHHLVDFFKDAVNHNTGRIVISVHPDQLYTINEIFEAAENKHRKIVLMGKKLLNIVNFAKTEGYMTFQDDLLGDVSNIKDQNSIIIIANDRTNPFAHLNKILSGYDKFISLTENDTIVIAERRYDSTEKTLVKLENELAKKGCKIINVPKDKEISHHASTEDLMFMIKLMNPKYFMPVKGEYRYMVNHANIANEMGIKPENIILKQNGESVTIENKELLTKFEKIKTGDIQIDGNTSDDVGELVIKDREMLSENGIVLISATLSRKDKTLLVGPEITTRGFVYIKDSQDLIEVIKEKSEEIILRNVTPKYVDYNNIRSQVREELSKYLYKETECKPMIIAVVQEV